VASLVLDVMDALVVLFEHAVTFHFKSKMNKEKSEVYLSVLNTLIVYIFEESQYTINLQQVVRQELQKQQLVAHESVVLCLAVQHSFLLHHYFGCTLV
jgi:hypothetical protein